MSESYFNIPMVIMRNLVVFPEMIIHFDVGREKSVNAVNKAMDGDMKVFLAAQKDIAVEDPSAKEVSVTGCVANIKQVLKAPGDSYLKIMVEGVCRAKITDVLFEQPYFSVNVEVCNSVVPKSNAVKDEAVLRKIKTVFDRYSQISGRMSPDIISHILTDDDCGHLCDYIASNIPLQWEDKQAVLAALNTHKRAEQMITILTKECEILAIDNDIHKKVQESIDENQREYFLREQLKVINSELGFNDDEEEIDLYRKSVDELKADEEVKIKLFKEIDKLEKQPNGSHESAVIRGYLDCCIDLPWGEYTKDKINLKSARALLDREHYGLEKVKQRIIEFLAVKKLTSNNSGSILCLVGPPGVGKTSIASSVAKCMGRKFARISLGGIKDESEIRGHRRTYIGSMPGRIISAISDTKSSNCVILLDEIDKIGNDFKGDCSSALLEVLDPEQNKNFKDHYLDLPFDLSNVLFITTANDASAIPAALYDRMEIIELSSYTAAEKFNIAKKHLVKKQVKLNGLDLKNIKICDDAINLIIDNYTREGGVRNLEKTIASLCRKTAVKVLDGAEKVIINSKNLTEFLGVKKFKTETVDGKKDEVGVVNGLAWTSVGGEIMEIEAAVLPGNGKIELTGSLGDVMKESAKTAVSYVRSVADKYGIDKDFYKNRDIHINATEGAVPKDGPSAGITMAVCILSALSGMSVKHDVAMTGEITLRGKVLAIGGLKEKTMAAYKAGIKTVIVPSDNRSDISELDKVIKENINFIYADKISNVIPAVLNINSSENKTIVQSAHNKHQNSYAHQVIA